MCVSSMKRCSCCTETNNLISLTSSLHQAIKMQIRDSPRSLRVTNRARPPEDQMGHEKELFWLYCIPGGVVSVKYVDVTSLSTPLAVYLCLHTCVWLWWLFASFISQQTQRAIQRPEMQQRDNLEQQRHLRAAGHAWCKQEQRPSKHEPALKCCRP